MITSGQRFNILSPYSLTEHRSVAQKILCQVIFSSFSLSAKQVLQPPDHLGCLLLNLIKFINIFPKTEGPENGHSVPDFIS